MPVPRKFEFSEEYNDATARFDRYLIEENDRGTKKYRQRIYRLPNGHEVSVVISAHSYGGDRGLYEAYDLHASKGHRNPEGFLSPESVAHFLDRVSKRKAVQRR